MGIFNWETSFFGKQKQQEGDAVCLLVSNPSDWSLSPKKKKHIIVTPTPATSTTKEDKEKEEQERSEKKKRVTQEKEEGLNPSHRSPKKKKRRAERLEEMEVTEAVRMKEAERRFSTRLGGPTTSVVYYRDHNPLKSTYVDHRLVGFCNKALEKYNNHNNHNCLYEYVRLLKAEKTSVSYNLNYEIIFDASLPHEDGFRVETFEASIKTGLRVQKGVEGYGEVVSKVDKYIGSKYGPWIMCSKRG
ncbi:hypothetical protein POM88_011120 [Heracleum sosnowskyi]|uniref:Uncharacterized protein n=1 Tax=Heracleum sosnowskyi TaxID=360622 RepID=A0AAD8ITX3_9APIA|nr:hypothetical protein POM88_011120 [Heracleum sosnowskyi]